MFFELREYRIRHGQRDTFARLMDEVILPFQRAKGMCIVGSFTALEDDDLYVWIRRFDSEQQRKRLYDEVYGDPRWSSEIKPALGDMLVREATRVLLLQSTPLSPL